MLRHDAARLFIYDTLLLFHASACHVDFLRAATLMSRHAPDFSIIADVESAAQHAPHARDARKREQRAALLLFSRAAPAREMIPLPCALCAEFMQRQTIFIDARKRIVV